ncbi:MAG: PKD domain-containing protein [Candidatus Thermoplasmatota archaeon]|nr:PKD domain-containing protein [Candidatus Thermoplasmatota archaeon]
MNIVGKRAVALTLVMALTMVAFAGFCIADEVLPDPIGVTVTDDYGTTDDSVGYVGTVFNFSFADTLGIGLNASWFANLTYELTIGTSTYDMGYVGDVWFYEFTATEAGVFDWEVNVTDVNNVSNYVVETGQITVNAYPGFVSGTAPALMEDQEYLIWNLTGYFAPEGLTYTNVIEYNGVELAIADETTGGYILWNLTVGADLFGYALVNVTASDGTESDYNVFNITVGAENDDPVIEYVNELEAEIWNYTTEVNETDVPIAWEFREVVNLTTDEEVDLLISVDASDVDMDNLTYEITTDCEVVTFEQNMTVWNNFTLVPDADASGDFWAILNVSDGEGYDWVYLYITIASVNDDPVLNSVEADVEAAKTGENVTFTAYASDIDGDDLTYTWKDGSTVIGTEASISVNFSEAGIHNITVEMTDGTVMVSGYVEVNISLAVIPNTAPTWDFLGEATAAPVFEGGAIEQLSDMTDWLANYEVQKGLALTLSCAASDDEEDELTYTWTNNVDTDWSETGETVTIPKDTLEPGKYIFTVVCTDGEFEITSETVEFEVTEGDDGGSGSSVCLIVIIVIALLVVIIIIVIIVMKKGKKGGDDIEMPAESEEMPVEEGMEQPPMEGMEQPPMEGMEQPPMEGMEQPPMEGMEQPPMEGVEQPPMEGVEQPIPEQPVAPVPEAAPPQPPAQPVAPAAPAPEAAPPQPPAQPVAPAAPQPPEPEEPLQ